MKQINRWAVWIMVMGVGYFLWTGLQKKPIIPYAMAHAQQFPEFHLSDIRKTDQQVSLQDMKGTPFVVHIWASWCGACLKEHALWVDMQKKYDFPLVGILYRDKVQKTKHFLISQSDPYLYLLSDPSGSVGIDLGIAGVPATFLVDATGHIRYVHFGEISRKTFEEHILPTLAINKSFK